MSINSIPFCTFRYSDSTKKKAMWAYRVFFDWKMHRNIQTVVDPGLKFIGDILEMSNEDMIYALTRFILEVRDKKGDYYTRDTLYELIIAIQMYCHMYGKFVKFLEDDSFIEVRNALDNQMKFLASKGYSCPREKADAIEVEDEDKMWLDGVLGESNPKQLVDTVLYLLGVHFALRAGKEHKALQLGDRSQLVVKYDRVAEMNYIEYTEDTSKTNQGGLKHRHLKKKVSRAYENQDNPERCVVRLFNKYVSLRPPNAPDDLYLRPLANPKEHCWYYAQPIGINALGKIVGKLVGRLGIEGRFTNHSCRATAASRMYQNNCEEQLVMEKTGHRSSAVRGYKRTSEKQLREVSNILYGKPKAEVADEPVCKKPCTVSKPPEETCEGITVEHGENSSKICINLTVNVNK